MNRLGAAVVSGAVGALATNILHESLRRVRSDAPRVDLLGMQALAKMLALLEVPIPKGKALYGLTAMADLASNSAYFALVGAAPAKDSIVAGLTIGVAAGLGATALPAPLGLATQTTNRTFFTRIASVALYTAGGFVAGFVRRSLSRSAAAERSDYFRAKHVVVTGGSRGLGFVVTRKLLDLGARVTICGRNAEALQSAAAQLGAVGDSLTVVQADVRERADCERLIATAVQQNGPVDVLINNAGVIEVGPFSVQTVDDYREAMDTHFWGPLYTMLAALPAMRARHSGQIVNVASIGGVVGVPHLAPYSASKFAQIGLTQALGAELAADGIRMTSIVPGLMITGSPEHAVFRGRNRAEYAWFTLSDANPLISVSADAAARRILQAIRRGKAQAVIGPTAKGAQVLNALLPQTTTALLRFAGGLLPAAGGIGTERRTGAQSHSAWTQNPLTWLNRSAAERNNQSAHPDDTRTS
jgi:NAD(P)-dependent dehydrogenase (short-subunit alcohol dehydrogenase family)